MTEPARINWTVLLPVKVLALAKSRLAVLAGSRRWELALAMESDTVAAALACPEVARVIVITSDPLAGKRLAALGAIIVPDGSGGPGGFPERDDGRQDALNAALLHGAAEAARRWPGTGLAALTADLPALRPAELGAALRAAARAPGVPGFVPDAAGVGTTMYAVAPGGDFRPAFGGASRARHARAGAAELALDGVPGLRHDVDTPDDLRAAVALGAGFRTTAIAAELFTQD
jgi:2-phospho-L-lactate guanylyltransferase